MVLVATNLVKRALFCFSFGHDFEFNQHQERPTMVRTDLTDAMKARIAKVTEPKHLEAGAEGDDI